ncbi:MAG: hypoxanthine-guanine phosphoribosyltransferase [Gammaproteobacteria bacterium]|nr:hypoxanthine-guanine phosphoribosyltransferase [Gammaproteobacteria bacterium]
MSITAEQARQVYAEADQLYSPEQVNAALDRMAAAIAAELAARDPIVVCVMTGGLIPAGHLLTRLDFPLHIDYLHATRYRGGTRGGELHWITRPLLPFAGRTVLVVDDILDEGLTLAAIQEELRTQGAAEVYSAVLVKKQHERRPVHITADFVGLEVVDRYVFGCGMDYHGYHRNLPGIYAVRGM